MTRPLEDNGCSSDKQRALKCHTTCGLFTSCVVAEEQRGAAAMAKNARLTRLCGSTTWLKVAGTCLAKLMHVQKATQACACTLLLCRQQARISQRPQAAPSGAADWASHPGCPRGRSSWHGTTALRSPAGSGLRIAPLACSRQPECCSRLLRASKRRSEGL